MRHEPTPRECREIFVACDGEVFDYEDEPIGLVPGSKEDLAICRQLDAEAHERYLRDAPSRRAAQLLEQALRRQDAWAANRAFAFLGIAPTPCQVNTWGVQHIDVHVPGRRIVRVTPDGECRGGEAI